MPKKPMNIKQVENYIQSLVATCDRLQAENTALKNDNDKIKNGTRIKEFLGMTKSAIMGLTAAEKNLLIFRVLRELCWSTLEDE